MIKLEKINKGRYIMKETKKCNINKEKIMLFLIILVQIIVYVFLGVQKTYIHMDEAYSIGLTNYDKVEITQNEDFYNNWHNKEYYEDYISISKEEALDLKPVYENQKNDVHPPFYYLLLRIAYSFDLDSFSKWPLSEVSIPPIRLRSVDLPEPEGPNNTQISPDFIVKLIFFNTSFSP